MVYLSKNNKAGSGKKKYFFFLAVIVVIVLFYFKATFFLTEPLNYIARPVWWFKNYSSEIISDTVNLFKTKASLVEENKKLKKELNYFSPGILLNQLLVKENNELKKILGRNNGDQKIVLANILAKPNLSPYDSLIIDAGEAEGLNRGDKVFVNNAVIGEVADVYLKTANVRLYSFPNEILDVMVGFNKILGTAMGKGGGNFEMKFPQGVAISKGDVVVLPEMELFILGTVESILITPEDPLQTILFKTPVNIFELRWVQILQGE